MVAEALQKRLLSTLEDVQHAGFCGGGTLCRNINITLSIEGVGSIGLPLAEETAAAITQQCEVAPFGGRDHTLVDKSVRDTLQLSPDKLAFDDPAGWSSVVQDALEESRRALGVPEGAHVEAQLYKLLLYPPGGHFAPHRDSEKFPGMFGTLNILLPSSYKGGQLVVRHGRESNTFDLAASNQRTMCWAAFYADCEHQVLPVSQGHRLVLVYHLIQEEDPAYKPAPPSMHMAARLRPLLEEWARDYWAPERMCYMLSHRYTPAGLTGLQALKGRDRAVAELLVGVGSDVGMAMHVGIMTKCDKGMHYSTSDRVFCPSITPSDLAMEDIFESYYQLSHWVPLLGNRGVGVIDRDADPDLEILQGEKYWPVGAPMGAHSGIKQQGGVDGK